jgi:hypothetical protein
MNLGHFEGLNIDAWILWSSLLFPLFRAGSPRFPPGWIEDLSDRRFSNKSPRPFLRQLIWAMFLPEEPYQESLTDFPRRLIVEAGFVKATTWMPIRYKTGVPLWAPSHVQALNVEFCSRMRASPVFTFEFPSQLQRIDATILKGGGLIGFTIPASVKIIGPECFRHCYSLRWIGFELGSTLDRIEASAFEGAGLQSVVLPNSISFLGPSCFRDDRRLQSIGFEKGSILKHTGVSSFCKSGLTTVILLHPLK